MAILAEYSFSHSPEMLAKKYTEFWLSSNWVAIKEAVRKLHIKKSTLEADQEGLQCTILNIALTNQFVCNSPLFVK
ncbi:hypothetical protein L208DRAFT_1390454 [Tricholoma matsutake]|nr:hypothetical protein L208DRAFT_1390454 [Tricholoma matsutake 945]